MILATSSIIATFNFNSFSGVVSTSSACNHVSSSAFSLSISTTKIPWSCAFLTTLPAATNDLPAPLSPAKTVTLPKWNSLMEVVTDKFI